MAEEKDYSLGGKDRPEWDRLWGAKTKHLLPGECRLDVTSGFSAGDVKAVTITDDPPGLVFPLLDKSEICPVCGESMAGQERIAVALNVAVVYDFEFLVSAWAHPGCFARCTDTGEPIGIPW